MLTQAELSIGLKPYWIRRSELTIECGCLLWGTRIIIPNKLRQVIQEELHTGHPGIVRMHEGYCPKLCLVARGR